MDLAHSTRNTEASQVLNVVNPDLKVKEPSRFHLKEDSYCRYLWKALIADTTKTFLNGFNHLQSDIYTRKRDDCGL